MEIETKEAPALAIDCYLEEPPVFVAAELARLYGHVYCSMPYFRHYTRLENACTYVARRDGRCVAVLLFERRPNEIRILNRVFHIAECEIARFSHYIFTRFPNTVRISFDELETGVQSLAFPFQRYGVRKDFSLQPPATKEEYTSRLGKATRRNIKRYASKLERDHPGYRTQFLERQEIRKSDVDALIALSACRMAKKKKTFSIDPEYARRMVDLCRECGFMTVVTIDGRLCAGLICFRIGDSFSAQLVAHDTQYDDYWLGTLSYYLTICEAIDRGAVMVNMGCGSYDYKTRLLATSVELQRLEIFQSIGLLLRNPTLAVRSVGQRMLCRSKAWLVERESSVLTRCAMQGVYLLRKWTSRGAGSWRLDAKS